MRTARHERVEAGGQQENEQRPVVGLRPEARAPGEHEQTPQEIPAGHVLRPPRSPATSASRLRPRPPEHPPHERRARDSRPHQVGRK